MNRELSTEHQARNAMWRFLCRMKVAALATVDDAGMPYVVNLYMACDDFARLYFTSESRTRHCRHIHNGSEVHMAAYEPDVDWPQLHGIQIHGTCQETVGAQRDHARSIFFRRFPDVARVLKQVAAAEFYCVTPSRIRWIDNRIRFGFKAEFPWPLPAPSQD